MRRRDYVTRAAVLALCIAALPSACTREATPQPSPWTPTPPTSTHPPSATPSPSVDPAVAAAEPAILEAYRGYWAAKVLSFAQPDAPQDPNLAHFAVDTALSDAQSALISMEADGIAFRGDPVLDPVVTEVRLGDAATAKITDCVDVSDWQPYFQATNETAAAPGQAAQVLTVSTAYFIDGRWTIRASDVSRETSC